MAYFKGGMIDKTWLNWFILLADRSTAILSVFDLFRMHDFRIILFFTISINTILKKLKQLIAGIPQRGKTDIMLQFDIGNKPEYLPLSNQIQTVESRIINLVENIKSNNRKHEYYNDLLSLNINLLTEVEKKIWQGIAMPVYLLWLPYRNNSWYRSRIYKFKHQLPKLWG